MALPVRVVAAAICDEEGRWLLADRPPGKHLAGLFEFPGGKVEPGEGDEAALARELEEELGVACAVGRLLTQVEHSYPERTVHLLLYFATIQSGVPTPREGQTLRWVRAEDMHELPMPAADAPLIQALRTTVTGG